MSPLGFSGPTSLSKQAKTYVSFLQGRKQRAVYNSITCHWKIVYKGTTQGSISGPYIFNLFLNDLDMDEHKDITLFKYAGDSTVLVTISRHLPDKSEIA